jgi:hypothetical protein
VAFTIYTNASFEILPNSLTVRHPPTDAARSEIQALQENNDPQTPAPYYSTLASQERPTCLGAHFSFHSAGAGFFHWEVKWSERPPYYEILRKAEREEDLRTDGEDRLSKKGAEDGMKYGS